MQTIRVVKTLGLVSWIHVYNIFSQKYYWMELMPLQISSSGSLFPVLFDISFPLHLALFRSVSLFLCLPRFCIWPIATFFCSSNTRLWLPPSIAALKMSREKKKKSFPSHSNHSTRLFCVFHCELKQNIHFIASRIVSVTLFTLIHLLYAAVGIVVRRNFSQLKCTGESCWENENRSKYV